MAEQQPDRGAVLSLTIARPGGTPPAKTPSVVAFTRHELQTILNLYGRKVGAGEWRDYALDFLRERALFSIYKRNSERPIYIVEKNPKLRNRQGQYTVSAMDGRILKRGHELDVVLRVLEPRLVVVK